MSGHDRDSRITLRSVRATDLRIETATVVPGQHGVAEPLPGPGQCQRGEIIGRGWLRVEARLGYPGGIPGAGSGLAPTGAAGTVG